MSISIVRTRDPLARGHLGYWDLHLNKLKNRPLGNASYQIFKHLDQEVLNNKICYFFKCISIFEPLDHLGSWDLCLNRLGKDYQTIPHTNFKHLSQIVLKKKKIFNVFLWFELKTPWRRAILDLHLNILGKEPPDYATYHISST